jgi:TetR/AcrR family fatty acid metabolism transcriptional regulator
MAPRNALKRQVNRLPPERRISDIMAAAKEVFTEKGYHDALITDIALRAGVVEGSIYRFFANKRELLVKVVEHWFEELLQDEAEHFTAVRGSWNQIRFLVYNHLLSIRRDPALSRLMFQEIRPAPDYRGSRLFELNRAYTHRLVDVVKAGIASGELRPDASPSLVRDLVFGCIEHRTWTFLRGEGDYDPVETADAITNLVHRGLILGDPASPVESVVARLEIATARLEAAAGLARAKPSSSGHG